MSTETTMSRRQLRELVADTLDVDPEELTDEALFVDDLEVDSLIALELAVTLERHYRVTISEQEMVSIRRFPDVYDLVVGKLGG